ncbi:hypothetical protein GCM10027291_06040 [Telluribacter humicola]
MRCYQTLLNYCNGNKAHTSTENAILSALERLEADRIRQTNQINNTYNQTAFQVVPLNDFNILKEEVNLLKGQLEILMKSQLAAHQWVNTKKASAILNCSQITLHRKKDAGELEFRMVGRRVAYNINSLIKYLESKHFKPEVINERVMTALSN